MNNPTLFGFCVVCKRPINWSEGKRMLCVECPEDAEIKIPRRYITNGEFEEYMRLKNKEINQDLSNSECESYTRLKMIVNGTYYE